MADVLTALGATLACALELFEALAIVLAVALTARARDALVGAVAAVVLCVAGGVVLGPLLVSRFALQPLRLVIGAALLWFGVNWLRKNVLRLAGRKARSSSFEEFEHEREELAERGGAWSARAVAFQGVLLEGFEVIVIVTALAERPGGAVPALAGLGFALLITLAIGVFAHAPLRRIPETELKYVVGILLTTFGTFLIGEGAGLHWPLADGALLVIAAVLLAGTQLLITRIARA